MSSWRILHPKIYEDKQNLHGVTLRKQLNIDNDRFVKLLINSFVGLSIYYKAFEVNFQLIFLLESLLNLKYIACCGFNSTHLIMLEFGKFKRHL